MGVVQAVRHPMKTSNVQVFATNLKLCQEAALSTSPLCMDMTFTKRSMLFNVRITCGRRESIRFLHACMTLINVN